MMPTRGAFLTCMEMCTNGQRMLSQITLRAPKPIRLMSVLRTPGMSFVAVMTAAGTSLRAASRRSYPPSRREYFLGFRVGLQQLPDTVSPELELFGGTEVPHELGELWAEPGYAASDNRDGNLTSSVSIFGTPNINTSGTYILTYMVADAAGNEANATRAVTVIDSGTDTDGDGFDDYVEAVAGSGSNDSTSTPFQLWSRRLVSI